MGFTIIDETLRDDLQRVDLNVGFARAVVDGVVHGEVWVSSAAPSGAAHVQHPYGMSLVWGDRVDLGFDEIIERLSRGAYRHRDEYLRSIRDGRIFPGSSGSGRRSPRSIRWSTST